MRLHVQASGISEGLLTAKCGSVKRQHVLHGASEAPFQLSLVKPPLPLEIEASVRRGKQCQESLVQSRQADGLYKVPLRGKHGQRMSVTFRAQPLSKAEKAKQAKEDRADAYFQKHGLNEFLKGMFDRLASEQPEDPYSFLRELYADAAKAERGEGQGNAQTCPPAEAEEPAVLTEPAAAETSAVTAQAEAEKPAVQTEPVQSKPDVAADSSATVAAQAGVEEPAVQPQPDVAADPSATVAAQAAVQTEPVKPTPDVAADSSATAAAQAATSVSLQALRRKARDAISKGYVDGGLVNALQKLPAFQAATPGSLPIAQGEAPVNQSSSVREQEPAVQTETVQPAPDVAEPSAVAAEAEEPTPAAAEPSADEVVAEPVAEPVQPTPDVAAGSPATGPPAQATVGHGGHSGHSGHSGHGHSCKLQRKTSEAATPVSLQALRRKARDAISKGYVDGRLATALQQNPACQVAPGSLPLPEHRTSRKPSPSHLRANTQPTPFLAEPLVTFTAPGSETISLHALRRKARDAISKGYVDGRLATALQTLAAVLPSGLSTFQLPTLTRAA
ncbi:unnamed protein product [Effrenium voratum]|nr:unnamed protein product [Effrenium voratum]